MVGGLEGEGHDIAQVMAGRVYLALALSSGSSTQVKRPGAKALDGLEAIIEGWLEDDKKRPRKQRHTSRRVFDRLVAEYDYTGSYSPVQRYIKVIDVGSAEAFRDECIEYSSGLLAAGVQTELHARPGGFHGFDLFGVGTPVSNACFAAREDWLRRV